MPSHASYTLHDTIAAIATPLGEGAIAIIRLSGKQAVEIAQKIFNGNISSYHSHTLHLGKIFDFQGHVVDHVLLALMRAPNSYTGEDIIELQCHGGSLITRRILDLVINAGARASLPGEFSYRAFINGKLDLAQAEAVQELIAAKNELALSAAEKQLCGSLSEKIISLQKELIDIAAILEAWIDFPEEGLEFASLDEIVSRLQKILEKIKQLEQSFYDGKILREGLCLCLVGSPNVGKSSLMNALLGKDRSIVTPIAGTTRDLLEEDLRLGSLHFSLIDTAGIRESEELVEQEGIRRSKIAMLQADLILLVLDASRSFCKEDEELLKNVPKEKTIVVWNKMDLPHLDVPLSFPYSVKISAKIKSGLEELKAIIDQAIWRKKLPSKEEIVITNSRHKEALSRAILSCEHLIDGLKKGTSPEFLTSDLKDVLNELGKIMGLDISEEILNTIFSKFCLGK